MKQIKKIITIIFLSIFLSGCGSLSAPDISTVGIHPDTIIKTNVTNPSLDVNIQDQTTATVILPLVQLLESTNLSIVTIINEHILTVDNSTNFGIGQHIRIINSEEDRFYAGFIIDINLNVITVDSPLDFNFSIGSEVTVSNPNMNVDGSVTPVIFTLRTGNLSIPSRVDITRIIIACESDSSVDLNKFCDLPALTNGIVFRKRNGIIDNIFNIKSNSDLANIAYDWTPYSASNPAQGVDGFISRLTFGGQNKIGVVLRIESDGNLVIWIQDDLTDLIRLSIVAEGHIVQD